MIYSCAVFTLHQHPSKHRGIQVKYVYSVGNFVLYCMAHAFLDFSAWCDKNSLQLLSCKNVVLACSQISELDVQNCSCNLVLWKCTCFREICAEKYVFLSEFKSSKRLDLTCGKHTAQKRTQTHSTQAENHARQKIQQVRQKNVSEQNLNNHIRTEMK